MQYKEKPHDPGDLHNRSHAHQSRGNLHRYRRFVWNDWRQAARWLDEMVSDHGRFNNGHWILFSVSRIHARHRSRNYFPPVSRDYDSRALFQTSGRSMALDLRDWCGDMSLLQLVCIGRAVV